MRIRQFKYKAQLLTKGHVEINKRHVNTNSFSKSLFFFFFFRPVHIVYTCVLIMWPLAFIMLIVLETEEEKKDQKLKKNKCWEKRWQK